jgi:cytochrome P450
VSMNGAQWKLWRALLNPGFSALNISSHVPFIADCVQIFCEKLQESVDKKIISLDEFTSRLTFDVIMKVTL